MNILLTGATGFVGRAFVEYARIHGMNVRAALRAKTTLYGVSESCIVGDIGPDTDWSSALVGCDAVVHLAARVHVMRDTATDPLALFRRVNTAGTLNLARQAAEAGVRRFVFISSIKVNGETQHMPYAETHSNKPQDAYAISKMEAEQGLNVLAEHMNLEVVSLRPPLIYGPGVGANFLQLMDAIDKGWPLPFSMVKNRRSLIYLGNLLDIIGLCLRRPLVRKVYLVSDGQDVSTPDLIRRLGEALGKTPRLLSVPPVLLRFAGRALGREAVLTRLTGSLIVDSDLVRRELNWTPAFSLQEGLVETVKWYRRRR